MQSTFGERLRVAMLAAGMETPAQLAKACGVSRQTASAWLKLDEARLSALHVHAVSRRLNVRMRWLIEGGDIVPMIDSLVRGVRREEFFALFGRMDADTAAKWLEIGQKMIEEQR